MPEMLETRVHEDAVEPGIEAFWVAKARPSGPCCEECLLTGIFRVRGVADDVQGEAIRTIQPRTSERLERLFALGPLHYRASPPRHAHLARPRTRHIIPDGAARPYVQGASGTEGGDLDFVRSAVRALGQVGVSLCANSHLLTGGAV
jgi:hypothetical protein